MSLDVIQVENVSKKFSKSLRYTMINAPLDLGRCVLGIDRRADKLRKGEFWAVEEVSFSLGPGERLGLIGRNGSGKSTLLKMLNGILMPDKGTIRIKGRVGALIEVGAGFHPLLTGRENIFINGAILGMTRAEMLRKFDEIVDFAGIGDFLDSPVKFYSSGMYVRLGFSVAVHSEPDILLVDEVLAVGDIAFQKKCFDRLESIVERGTTIIFVSHSIAAIQRFCQTVMFMKQGQAAFIGDSNTAAAEYYQSLNGNTFYGDADTGNNDICHKDAGSSDVYLHNFEIHNESMMPIQKIESGSSICFQLTFRTLNNMVEFLPRTAIRIIDLQTEDLVANIQTPRGVLRNTKLNGELRVECAVPFFNVAPGMYKLEIKVGGDGEHLYDIAVITNPLEVCWSGEIVDSMSYKGKIYLPGEWSTTGN